MIFRILKDAFKPKKQDDGSTKYVGVAEADGGLSSYSRLRIACAYLEGVSKTGEDDELHIVMGYEMDRGIQEEVHLHGAAAAAFVALLGVLADRSGGRYHRPHPHPIDDDGAIRVIIGSNRDDE